MILNRKISGGRLRVTTSDLFCTEIEGHRAETSRARQLQTVATCFAELSVAVKSSRYSFNAAAIPTANVRACGSRASKSARMRSSTYRVACRRQHASFDTSSASELISDTLERGLSETSCCSVSPKAIVGTFAQHRLSDLLIRYASNDSVCAPLL